MPNTVKISAEFTGLTQSLEKQILAATRGQGVKIPVNDKAFNQSFTGMTANVRRFEQSLDISNRRVIAFGTSASIVYGTVRAFKELVGATVQVEKTLTSINSIFGLTTRQLDAFSKSLFNVARLTGQAFDEVAEAAQEYSRQGLGVEETLKRTRDTMILVRLTGLDTAKAVSTLTAAVNTFSKAGEDSTSILNKIVAADQRFAVSARDIAEAFQRVGSVVDDAGVNINEFIGLVTAAKQITSRDGAVIGNSLKTIFTRLERSTTIDDLEALGIAVRDASGAAKPALQVFDALAKTYGSLGREQQNLVAQLGGGVFQINQFKALLLDLGKASGVASQAERASATATNQALIRNAALNDTLATSIQNLKTSATEAASTVGELTLKPLFKVGLQAGGVLDSLFGNISKTGDTKAGEDFGAYVGESILKGIGNVLSGPGLVFIIRALSGVLSRTLPEIGRDVRASANLTNNAFQNPRTYGGAIRGALAPTGEAEAISRTNTLIAQGTKEEQARYVAARNVAEQEAAILAILQRQAVVQAELAGAQRGLSARIASEEAGLGAPAVRNLRGRRTPFSASGYLPIGAESSAIAQGVGGAPTSARPVFLGGFKRPDGMGIVANTSEFIVPGAAGGYPAIYNRDMVKRMGLPPGSTPVAAGGFIPNAAKGDIPSEWSNPDYYKWKPTPPLAPPFGIPPGTPYARQGGGFGGGAAGQGFGQYLDPIANASAEWNSTLNRLSKGMAATLLKSASTINANAELAGFGPILQHGPAMAPTHLVNQSIAGMGGVFPYGPAAPSAQILSTRNAPFFNHGAGAPGESTEAYRARIQSQFGIDTTALPSDSLAAPGMRSRQATARERAMLESVEAKRAAERASILADNAAVNRASRRERFNGRLQTGLLVGSFASSFLPNGTSGQLSGQLSSAASSGLTGAATGGSFGSIFGPIGGAIGAGVGGLGGAVKGFIERMTKSFEEVAADIEKDNAKLKTQIDAAQQAFTLQDRLTEGRERGMKGPLLARTNRELSSSLANISDPKLRAFVLAGDQQGAAQYAYERQEQAATQQAIKLSFTKAITGGDYGKDTVASAASGLQSSYANLSDAELDKIRASISSRGSALALGLSNSEGMSFAGRVGLNLQGAQGGPFSGLLGGIGSLISKRSNSNVADFTQKAVTTALDAEVQRRADAKQADIAAKANSGSYISRLQSLQLASRIGVAGQIGQVQSSGALQIAQTQQGFALEGPGLSEYTRARMAGGFERNNIIDQSRANQLSTLTAGKSALIQSLGDSGVRDRALIERIAGVSDLGGLKSLQDDLKSIITDKAPEGTLAKAQDAIKDLTDRLTVMIATEQEAIKVSDTNNSLLRQQILKRQDVGFVTRNLRQGLQDNAGIEDAQNQATINLAKEGNPFVTGDALTGARLGQANRLGRGGASKGSFDFGFKAVFEGAKKEMLNFAEVGQQVASSLGNNFSNAFGDFVTGAKRGKDAFRDFVTGVLSDAARAFATKAVMSLLGMAFGGSGAGEQTALVGGSATGGFIKRADGGMIPTMLTGGEFVYPPAQTARIGGRMLKAINSGTARGFAPGGLVRGGSGVADDVFTPLPPESFVVRKAMVERYGADKLASLAIGGYPDGMESHATTSVNLATGGFASTAMSTPHLAMGSPLGLSAPTVHLAVGGSPSPMESAMAAPTPVMGIPVAAGGGTFSIGVTINDQRTTTQSSSSNDQNSSANSQRLGETMARRMKEVAQQVVQENQRQGGLLYRPSMA